MPKLWNFSSLVGGLLQAIGVHHIPQNQVGLRNDVHFWTQ